MPAGPASEVRLEISFVLYHRCFLCLHEACKAVHGLLLSDGQLVRVDLLLLLFLRRDLHRSEILLRNKTLIVSKLLHGCALNEVLRQRCTSHLIQDLLLHLL